MLSLNACWDETRYETTPIRYVHQYLATLGKIGATEKEFKEKMYDLWFEPYTRVAKNDSSGFEHVFMGEEVRQRDNTCFAIHRNKNCFAMLCMPCVASTRELAFLPSHMYCIAQSAADRICNYWQRNLVLRSAGWRSTRTPQLAANLFGGEGGQARLSWVPYAPCTIFASSITLTAPCRYCAARYIPPKPWRRGGTALSPDEDEQLLQIQFGWTAPGTTEECLKRVGASFIGTSVQFDLALYTLFFAAGGGEDKHTLYVGPYKTELTCHRMNRGSHVKIGTSYPACAPMTDDEAATHVQALVRGKFNRRRIGQQVDTAQSAAARKNAKRRAAKKKAKKEQLR